MTLPFFVIHCLIILVDYWYEKEVTPTLDEFEPLYKIFLFGICFCVSAHCTKIADDRANKTRKVLNQAGMRSLSYIFGIIGPEFGIFWVMATIYEFLIWYFDFKLV